MKKTAILMAVLAAAALVLAACSTSGTSSSSVSSSSRVLSDIVIASSPATKATASSDKITLSGSSSSQKVFTAAELATYNGKNGNPAYVAVNGVVYDVTNVKEWQNGTHQGLSAGQDLTSQIAQSPHGTSVLSGLTVVGTYQG